MVEEGGATQKKKGGGEGEGKHSPRGKIADNLCASRDCGLKKKNRKKEEENTRKRKGGGDKSPN